MNIQDPPEILDRLSGFLILERQDKVQVGLIVHLAFKGLDFLKNSVDKDIRDTPTVIEEFLFLEKPILILIYTKT